MLFVSISIITPALRLLGVRVVNEVLELAVGEAFVSLFSTIRAVVWELVTGLGFPPWAHHPVALFFVPITELDAVFFDVAEPYLALNMTQPWIGAIGFEDVEVRRGKIHRTLRFLGSRLVRLGGCSISMT